MPECPKCNDQGCYGGHAGDDDLGARTICDCPAGEVLSATAPPRQEIGLKEALAKAKSDGAIPMPPHPDQPPRQALAILNRWQRAMDNPDGPPLEVHHADPAVLRAALQEPDQPPQQQPQQEPQQEQPLSPLAQGLLLASQRKGMGHLDGYTTVTTSGWLVFVADAYDLASALAELLDHVTEQERKELRRGRVLVMPAVLPPNAAHTWAVAQFPAVFGYGDTTEQAIADLQTKAQRLSGKDSAES